VDYRKICGSRSGLERSGPAARPPVPFAPVAASDRSAALARLVDRDASDDHPGDPAAA
jgi:hypothetical protein